MTFPPTPGHDPHCRDTAHAVLAFADDHPMPADLAEQVAAWIAPHAIAAGIPHDHAMRCAAIAFPLIREYLAGCIYDPRDTDPLPAVAPPAPAPSGLSDAELLAALREPTCATPAVTAAPAPAYPVAGGDWQSRIGELAWSDVLRAHKFGPLAFGVYDALVRHGIAADRIELDGTLFPDQDDPRTRIEVRITVPGQSGARDGRLTRTLVDKGEPAAVAGLGHDEIAQGLIARLTAAEHAMPVIPADEPAAMVPLAGVPVFGQQPPPQPSAPPAEPYAGAPALDETSVLGPPIPVAAGIGAAAAPGQTWQL